MLKMDHEVELPLIVSGVADHILWGDARRLPYRTERRILKDLSAELREIDIRLWVVREVIPRCRIGNRAKGARFTNQVNHVEAKPREGLNRASTSTVTTSSVVSAGKGASRVRPSETQVEGEKDEPSLAVVPKGPSKPRDTKKENEIAKQELAELDKFEQNELIGKLGSKDQAKKTLRLKEYNKAVGGMR